MLHRRYAPTDADVRAEPLERFHALPAARPRRTSTGGSPTSPASIRSRGPRTEPWRRSPAPPSLLQLDVAGIAQVGEAAIEIANAPEGIRFEPLVRRPRAPVLAGRVGREVRGSQRGHVEARPARAGPTRGGRSRSLCTCGSRTRSRAGRSSGASSSSRSRRAASADRGVRVREPRPDVLLECRRGDRRPRWREGRVRVRPEPLAEHLALRVASCARRARR